MWLSTCNIGAIGDSLATGGDSPATVTTPATCYDFVTQVTPGVPRKYTRICESSLSTPSFLVRSSFLQRVTSNGSWNHAGYLACTSCPRQLSDAYYRPLTCGSFQIPLQIILTARVALANSAKHNPVLPETDPPRTNHSPLGNGTPWGDILPIFSSRLPDHGVVRLRHLTMWDDSFRLTDCSLRLNLRLTIYVKFLDCCSPQGTPSRILIWTLPITSTVLTLATATVSNDSREGFRGMWLEIPSFVSLPGAPAFLFECELTSVLDSLVPSRSGVPGCSCFSSFLRGSASLEWNLYLKTSTSTHHSL